MLVFDMGSKTHTFSYKMLKLKRPAWEEALVYIRSYISVVELSYKNINLTEFELFLVK